MPALQLDLDTLQLRSALDYHRLIWRFGRPADFWLTHSREVAQFVQTNDLAPAPSGDPVRGDPMPPGAAKGKAEAADTAVLRWPPPFPGGIRVAHLHLGANTYLLTEEQWKKFSEPIVKAFQEKLASAKTIGIGFQQFMELSEAIEPFSSS